MSSVFDLLDQARGFIAGDPDPSSRSELSAITEKAATGDAAALAELEDRFRGPLVFGTAGLRGLIGAGENRINRATILRATFGLLTHVAESVPEAKTRGVVIGRDARRMSAELQADAAAVAHALGFRVYFFRVVCPTPLVAFGVRVLGAACGVMITASHNPPAYNGYKVYWENGAQIIPPQDAAIAAAINRAPRASDVPRLEAQSQDVTHLFDAYLDAIDRTCVADNAPAGDLIIAYSALHGVGEKLVRRAFARRGFAQFHSVAEQAEPDGTFPTVEFPNPEEPGALDRVLALARSVAADVVLVNDPDADRLGVAVLSPETSEYVVLNGNEIGVLLGHHLLVRGRDRSERAKDRLVIATVVSSQLLSRVAEKLGVRYASTLTGFKWIANEAMRLEAAEGLRFVFGYEEALGYTVGDVVRDKDGISAALVMAELAALLKKDRRTLLDELEQIRRTFGFFLSRQKSVTLPGREGAAKIAEAMGAFRERKIAAIGGVVVHRVSMPAPDVVILELAGGTRIAVRPSGTEPKIKFYFEIAEPIARAEAMREAEMRGREKLVALEKATLAFVGL